MAATSFEVHIFGTEKLVRNIRNKERRARDMTPVFRLLQRDFRTVMRRQFDQQGAYLGSKWAPLALATVENKSRYGMDPRILHRTRRMRKSFTVGTEGFRVLTPNFVEFGTEVPYAWLHQEGTDRMPERKIFEFTEDLTERWKRAMESYLARGVLRVPPG